MKKDREMGKKKKFTTERREIETSLDQMMEEEELSEIMIGDLGLARQTGDMYGDSINQVATEHLLAYIGSDSFAKQVAAELARKFHGVDADEFMSKTVAAVATQVRDIAAKVQTAMSGGVEAEVPAVDPVPSEEDPYEEDPYEEEPIADEEPIPAEAGL